MQYYTSHDIDICADGGVVLDMVTPDFALIGPQPQNAHALKRQRVAFQFPPKFSSDTRKGTWASEQTRGPDSGMAMWSTVGPREITMTWTYVVDGGKWTVSRIKENIGLVRGYYALQNYNASSDERLVIGFRAWAIGGNGIFSARLTGAVDVKYSDTYVSAINSNPAGMYNLDALSFDDQETFPLRTDITIGLALWTRNGGLPSVDGNGDKGIDQAIRGLRATETVDWF